MQYQGVNQVVAAHARAVRLRGLCLVALALVACGLFCLDVTTGPSGLTAEQVFRGLLSPGSLSRSQAVIVFDVRLPQAVMAVLVGAALALSGAEMQTVLDNPLASPWTLGIASAAALGAAFGIVLGVGIPSVPQNWLVPANAFVFALGATAAIQLLSRLRGAAPDTLVLFGIATLFGSNAGIALLQFVASSQTLQQLVFWTLGGFARTVWSQVVIMAVVLGAVFVLSIGAAGRLNALRLGEDRARSLGIEVTRLQALSLFRSALLTATAVAFVGTIAFVGLVGPHLARLIVGEDHRLYLPGSVLSGAVVLSGASVASKLIVPGVVVPVGIVTSLVGVPVFLLLIFRRSARG